MTEEVKKVTKENQNIPKRANLNNQDKVQREPRQTRRPKDVNNANETKTQREQRTQRTSKENIEARTNRKNSKTTRSVKDSMVTKKDIANSNEKSETRENKIQRKLTEARESKPQTQLRETRNQKRVSETQTNGTQKTRRTRNYNKTQGERNNQTTNQIIQSKREGGEFRFKSDSIKIIPLGGLHEVGKNITVFEFEDEIIVVDCGLAFPEDDMLGVDLVIPDVTYLERNKEKIKGLVITHGHEDHIGSIPYLLKQMNIPIYATRLTAGLIRNKLEEHKLLKSTKLIEVVQGQTIKLGKFQIEFIRSSHSIPDSVMLAITTKAGTIVHTGDFKVDYTPIDGQLMDFGRIAEIGNKGVLALLSDSTNAERRGYTMSESTVGEVFERLFQNCRKRIVVATFASNVHRVQQIVNSAVAHNRKIAVCGRSMINMINTARELDYIEAPDNLFIDIDMIKNYTDDQLVIITTGSQGETMSALTRMASGEHKKVEITPNDLVIISATPIPGNEKLVSKVIDDLMQIGAEVIYSSLEDIHVSGHACQEEQKLILGLVKPKYFLPVHGEYRQIMAHSETAKSMGIPKENIFMLSNGRVLELCESGARFTGTVPFGRILVDGLGIGDVGNIVLRDRQHLSQDGLIIIVVTMDASTGTVVAGPDVISRGFVYVRESENLMDDVKNVIRNEISKCEENHITDWSTIKSTLRDNLRDYIYQKTKRNPMILPIIMEI